ncbi:TniQ family protein [Malaciobacter mytili]|uniref:TniQ family protein n=1 Tax=Malaciobacter mytili TaxID=603050 RepID=UPI003BB0D5B0
MSSDYLLFKDKSFKDELLSSWLTRLAHLNYINLKSFLGTYFPNKNYATKDIDLFLFDDYFYAKISSLTDIPIKNIKYLQLYKYQSYIEEDISNLARHHWVTPILHNIKKKNKFLAIRYCPHCLKEKAYFKSSWRIMFVNICLKHKIYLLNKCPNCSSIITYTKTNSNLEIYNCTNCNVDLRKSISKKVNINSDEYFYQNFLSKIAQNGYYIYQNNCQYSMGLFYLLRILARNIIKTDLKYETKYLEEFEPRTVAKIIVDSMLLLENYPHNLKYFCKKTKLTNKPRFYDKYRYKKEYIPSWFSI